LFTWVGVRIPDVSDKIVVEICVEDIESAMAAEQGGADRVELCDNLSVGGTTPSAGTIAEACRRLEIPVHVLIRPRAGDFIPSLAEFAAMRFDIETARTLGAAGVVFGLLRPDATIDRERTAMLTDLARPLSVTFHKAFDQTHDPDEALETLIALGIDRVLTSGSRPTAVEGIEALRQLVPRSTSRISVMAGGKLSVDNLRTVIEGTGVCEVHLGSAVSRLMNSSMAPNPGEGSPLSWNGVDADRVRRIVSLVASLGDERIFQNPQS
jgi:copper homeostasis protein